jgi:predicted metal-dependent hydrolase
MDQHSFQYGDERLDYAINYKPLKKHHLRIHVLHDGKVQVDAPASSNLKEIRQAVIKKARWIHNHVESAKQRASLISKREYVSGESHYYLGKQYLLKVHPLRSRLEKEKVRLGRATLDVFAFHKEPAHISYLLDQWYAQRAAVVFAKRIDACMVRTAWLKQTPVWKIRSMKKQWGSCSPKGVLSLNPKLIKAPRECIDYVIVHELCHIKEHNHSDKYYRLLKGAISEWKGVKGRLDEMAEILFNS